MGDTKFCFGCFEPINDETKCPCCGYKQRSPYSPSYIAPGTMLNDRYMVGKLISHNGEGATYLAYDTVISCKVTIKEYMPDALCTRDTESSAIIVNQNSNVQYKSLMEEFTELNKKIAKLRSISHIIPVLNLFNENNTAYAVYEYIDGENLIQYLKKNGGELSWAAVTKLFTPLFTSLSQLHAAGIVHRGISPQTIYVTKSGELMLTDFCIAAVRTTKTELNSEIFKGYAAPEQYSPSSWQGAWTDVYGISSVLYRILTGCMPIESILRNDSADLTPPSSLNSDIPDCVSEGIIDGMKLAGDERIQDITELVTRIFSRSDDDNTKTRTDIGNAAMAYRESQAAKKNAEKSYDEPQQTRAERSYDETRAMRASERPYHEPPRGRAFYDTSRRGKRYYNPEVIRSEEEEEELMLLERLKFPAFVAALVLIVIAFLVFFIKQLNIFDKGDSMLQGNLPALTTPPVTTEPVETAPEDDNPGFYLTNVPPATVAEATTPPEGENPEETTVTTQNLQANVKMPDLIGKIYDDVKVSTFSGDVTFDVKYVFDKSKKRGEILEQSVEEGVMIVKGEVVTITVCKGDGAAAVPDFKRGPKSCYPIQEYLDILDEAGIKYKAIPQVNKDYYSGYVIGTEPKAGVIIDSYDGEVLIVHFTDNSGNGTVILSPGVDASAQPPSSEETTTAASEVTTSQSQ